MPGVAVDLERVQTNMVYLGVADARGVRRELAPSTGARQRDGRGSRALVTHADLDDDDVAFAAGVRHAGSPSARAA
jgi:hypothetical protein